MASKTKTRKAFLDAFAKLKNLKKDGEWSGVYEVADAISGLLGKADGRNFWSRLSAVMSAAWAVDWNQDPNEVHETCNGASLLLAAYQAGRQDGCKACWESEDKRVSSQSRPRPSPKARKKKMAPTGVLAMQLKTMGPRDGHR